MSGPATLVGAVVMVIITDSATPDLSTHDSYATSPMSPTPVTSLSHMTSCCHHPYETSSLLPFYICNHPYHTLAIPPDGIPP